MDAVTDREGTPYDPGAFPPFAVTVDVLVFSMIDRALSILLVERGVEPYRGHWALPGGFVRPEESLEAAARRELDEETGVSSVPVLRQLGAYGDPERDPRMRVVTVAWTALLASPPAPAGGTDAAQARHVAVSRVVRGRLPLAFDHRRIVRDAVAELAVLIERSPAAAALCGEEFTMTALRRVYESVWGCELDPANFQRRVLATEGFVVPTGARSGGADGRGRPARLYRQGNAIELDPPLRRPASA